MRKILAQAGAIDKDLAKKGGVAARFRADRRQLLLKPQAKP
jgi:hypothetical protein